MQIGRRKLTPLCLVGGLLLSIKFILLNIGPEEFYRCDLMMIGGMNKVIVTDEEDATSQ